MVLPVVYFSYDIFKFFILLHSNKVENGRLIMLGSSKFKNKKCKRVYNKYYYKASINGKSFGKYK